MEDPTLTTRIGLLTVQAVNSFISSFVKSLATETFIPQPLSDCLDICEQRRVEAACP